MSFGILLKSMRKQKKMTQQTLADALGVHRNTVGNWESGTYLPATRGLVVQIARHLQDESHLLLQSALLELPE